MSGGGDPLHAFRVRLESARDEVGVLKGNVLRGPVGERDDGAPGDLERCADRIGFHVDLARRSGLAGGSHVWNKNIDWKLFTNLAVAGVIGGALGAYVLVGLPETAVKMFVSLYLVVMTGLIAKRAFVSARIFDRD